LIGAAVGRISERLASIAERAAPDSPIEVVVELAPTTPVSAPSRSRAERRALTSQLRIEFDARVARLEPALEAAGATVQETTWLNDSLIVVAPANMLGELARIDGVELLDVAAPVTPE
jgi:hypothetical protein